MCIFRPKFKPGDSIRFKNSEYSSNTFIYVEKIDKRKSKIGIEYKSDSYNYVGTDIVETRLLEKIKKSR